MTDRTKQLGYWQGLYWKVGRDVIFANQIYHCTDQEMRESVRFHKVLGFRPSSGDAYLDPRDLTLVVGHTITPVLILSRGSKSVCSLDHTYTFRASKLYVGMEGMIDEVFREYFFASFRPAKLGELYIQTIHDEYPGMVKECSDIVPTPTPVYVIRKRAISSPRPPTVEDIYGGRCKPLLIKYSSRITGFQPVLKSEWFISADTGCIEQAECNLGATRLIVTAPEPHHHPA